MALTLSCILTNFIFLCVSVALLEFFLRSGRRIRFIGIPALFGLAVAVNLRMFFPFEIPYSREIAVSGLFTSVHDFFHLPVINKNGQILLLYHIFLCIWAVGAGLSLFRMIYGYRYLHKAVSLLPDAEFPDLMTVTQLSNSQHGKLKNIRVVRTSMIDIPMIIGLHKATIVLPDIEFRTSELNYILRHEIAHYYRGDLIIKFLVACLTAIYWWNPLIWILQNQISRIMEIGADQLATENLDKTERVGYLKCILSVAKAKIRRRSSKRP